MIIDQVLGNLRNSFSYHKEVYHDLPCLGPHHSEEFETQGLPQEVMEGVCQKIGLNITKQLLHFGDAFPWLVKANPEVY